MPHYPDNTQFTTGFSFADCTVTKATVVKELCCRLVELQHSSGADIIHIQNEDPENLFCFAFKTLPTSSNGAPHILEHTVLCGSDTFPVRDPFFSMTRRSLNTFMNAFTGADCTCYPAASQMEKDFYNLLEVYADAVFHPKLDKLSFLQEGWRLEFDENNTLQRKGIVYNEMKGALASPLSLLHEKLSELLFQDSPYGYNSGGDPKVIPTLTHEALQEFHRTNYHPSRCLYYFYGSFSLAKHLTFLKNHVFQKAQTLPSQPLPSRQKRLKKPLYQEHTYPAAETEQEQLHYLSIGWLTAPCTDIKTILSLAILDGLLMENDSSPLKRYILDTCLAKQAYSSLDAELAEVPYTLTLTGTTKGPEEAANELVQILRTIAKKGFSRTEIDRVLHQIELQRREIVRDNAPYGLTLFWRSALAKLHGVDPLVGLQLAPYFAAIEKELESTPSYFSALMEKFLINNKHCVTVRITPSTTYTANESAREKQELKKIASTLTSKQKKQIKEEALLLEKRQNKKEDISCLPSIAVADIARTNVTYPLKTHTSKSIQYYFSEVFTNHIAYVTMAIPLPPEALKTPWILKLYSLLLPQLGCGDLSWQEALEYAQEYTGGICSYISLMPSVRDVDLIQPHLHIHGKALSKNLNKLVWLVSNYAHSTRLDETSRIEELVQKHATSLESALVSSSLRYANLESDKYFSLPGYLNWQMSGRDYLHNIRSAVKHWKQDHHTLVENMRQVQQHVLPSNGLKIIATCTPKEQEQLIHFFDKQPLHKHTSKKIAFSYTKKAREEYLAIDNGSAISFSSLSFPAMPYSSTQAPLARLLAPLLDNLVLHKRIREQGGAYGTGASYNPSNGVFSFYSYRDPNIWTSFQAFHEALQLVAQGSFSEEDLNEAKRECIQGMDDPVSPSSQAEIAFGRLLEGKTESMRKRFRTKLLNAKRADLQVLATQFLRENMPQCAFTTTAGSDLLTKEQELFAQEDIRFSTIVL